MAEELYDIVFKGELAKAVDLATAKQNVGKLFKMQGAKLDALFSGKTIVLKRGLDFDTASKYRVAIKKAGALVNIVEQQNAAPKPSPGKAVFGEQPSSTPAAASPSAPASTEAEKDDAVFTLAPAGSAVIEEKDRPQVTAVSVDVSGISLKDSQGDLLEDSEKQRFVEREIDLSEYDVAPPGADVLTEQERPKVKAVEVDLSGMEVAAAGERLSEPKPEPPPAPDVSKISLAD